MIINKKCIKYFYHTVASKMNLGPAIFPIVIEKIVYTNFN